MAWTEEANPITAELPAPFQQTATLFQRLILVKALRYNALSRPEFCKHAAL
jgi:hypothetical protein